MKGRLTVIFNLLFASCLLTGCVRSVYIPVSQNNPLFGENKEVQAVAYVGDNHVELQAAHNPTKKLAIAANVYFGSGVSIYDAALGTYGYNENKKWRWETFLGYGNNSNYAYQTANYNVLLGKPVKNYEVRSLYDKFYLQPSFGFFSNIKMYNIKYSFSFSSRISALYFKIYSFKEIDDAATQQSGQTVYITNKFFKNSFMYLLEPCLTNKIGVKNVNVILQIQGFFPYSEEIDIRNTVFSPGFIFSLGLQYNFVFKAKQIATSN